MYLITNEGEEEDRGYTSNTRYCDHILHFEHINVYEHQYEKYRCDRAKEECNVPISKTLLFKFRKKENIHIHKVATCRLNLKCVRKTLWNKIMLLNVRKTSRIFILIEDVCWFW